MRIAIESRRDYEARLGDLRGLARKREEETRIASGPGVFVYRSS